MIKLKYPVIYGRYVLNEIWSPIVERVNEVAEENDLEIPDNPYLSSASNFADIDMPFFTSYVSN